MQLPSAHTPAPNVSTGGSTAAALSTVKKGLEMRIANAVAELRELLVTLSVKVERLYAGTGTSARDGNASVGAVERKADLTRLLRCHRALLRAEVLLCASAAQWMDGLLRHTDWRSVGVARAAADAMIVTNQQCAVALAQMVRDSLDQNHENYFGGRAMRRWRQRTRRDRQERGVHALRILAVAARARPGRLRRFLQVQELVPMLCVQIEVWERYHYGRPQRQDSGIDTRPRAGLGVGGVSEPGRVSGEVSKAEEEEDEDDEEEGEKDADDVDTYKSRTGGLADYLISSRVPQVGGDVGVGIRLSETAVRVLLSLQASLSSMGRSSWSIFTSNNREGKGGGDSATTPGDIAGMVVVPLARALAVMARGWNQGFGGAAYENFGWMPSESDPAHDGRRGGGGSAAGHGNRKSVHTSSFAFASEGLLACALDEQRWQRRGLSEREALLQQRQTGDAQEKNEESGTAAGVAGVPGRQPSAHGATLSRWSAVVAALAPPFAADPFAPYLQWFPLLLCRLSHLRSVRAMVDSSGLRHVLRAIALNCWPPPWRSAPRSSTSTRLAKKTATTTNASSESVAFIPALRLSPTGMRDACATALCALGDTLRPTTQRWRSDGGNSRNSVGGSVLSRSGGVSSSGRRAGVRLLCIDGGGTRGVGTIVALKALQAQCGGRPMHELFDVICGTSTGGILAVAMGVLHRPLEEIEGIYKEFAGQVFASSNAMVRAGRTVLAGGAYSVAPLERILKEYGRDPSANVTMREYGCVRETLWAGESTDSARPGKTTSENIAGSDADDNRPGSCCRVFVVATTSVPPATKPVPFLFRNYGYPRASRDGDDNDDQTPVVSPSRHPGSNRHPPWECLRATTAAPGYFPAFTSGGMTYQDGALTANNPTGVAIHEAMRLFPNQPIGVVVSVGTGRFLPSPEATRATKAAQIRGLPGGGRGVGGSAGGSDTSGGSGRGGLLGTVKSAAESLVDTERVHALLLDLLGDGSTLEKDSGRADGVGATSYIRINPEITEVSLDENRPHVLRALQEEFRVHCEEEDYGKRAVRAAARALVGDAGEAGSTSNTRRVGPREGDWNAQGLWKGVKMLWRASSRL